MVTLKQPQQSSQYNKTKLASVGSDVFISVSVEIRRPQLVTIGNHVAIDTGFYCTTRAEIGDYIHIGPYVNIIGGADGLLKMEPFTNLAAGTKVICVSDDFTGQSLITAPGIPKKFIKLIAKPVTIKKFSNVGANVVIMPGVTLREGSVVGAGSVVTSDTKPWTIYVGSPARPIKARSKEAMLRFAKQLGYSDVL